MLLYHNRNHHLLPKFWRKLLFVNTADNIICCQCNTMVMVLTAVLEGPTPLAANCVLQTIGCKYCKRKWLTILQTTPLAINTADNTIGHQYWRQHHGQPILQTTPMTANTANNMIDYWYCKQHNWLLIARKQCHLKFCVYSIANW